jgi:hypothetical protein
LHRLHHDNRLTIDPQTFYPNIIHDAFIFCPPRHGRLGRLGPVCQGLQEFP